MTTILMPICMICKNRNTEDRGKNSCKAFPDGIPESILLSRHDHRKPLGGEVKINNKPILFNPIDDEIESFEGAIDLTVS